MGKRRFAQVSASDGEGEETRLDGRRWNDGNRQMNSVEEGGSSASESDEAEESDGGKQCDGEKEQEAQQDAKPVGDVIRVVGKGRNRKEYYAAFEYDGSRYELEDSVLLTPEKVEDEKPYIAIIKEITRDSEGNVMVTGQWFYRPEEAARKGGGNFQSHDTRELFYSFHLDEVPAETVMHKCVVHFVPPHKQLPARTEHPGFIVQKVYDTIEKKLWKLTDKDYEDGKQHEINLLIEKTWQRLGELPNQDDALSDTWSLRKKTMLSIDVLRDDNATTESSLPSKGKNVSEFCSIIKEFQVSTGDSYRDKWLEKLLQGIQFACHLKDSASVVDRGKTSGSASNANNVARVVNESEKMTSNASEPIVWPDDAVPAVAALEKAAHEALCSDFQKYNQKMRQLDFNLKNNAPLAKRLLKKELEPSVILNMSPSELKDGFTANEKRTQEPEQSRHMQMTDARCSRCMERKVGVVDIIHAGCGDRYQLECIACGHTWYASRDAISSLTLDAPSVAGNVGTAPWATAKFEVVEKKLISPRETEKSAADVLQKSTVAYMPVLKTQKSFNRA